MKTNTITDSSNLILTVLLALIFASCKNYQKKNNKFETEIINEEIKNTKMEAKLLVKVSEQNLGILNLCKVAKDNKNEDKLYVIANKIEEQHEEISKQLNSIAEEKLISIPRFLYENRSTEVVLDTSKETFKETYLKEVKRLLESQISTLNSLSDNSNDEDFKVLALKAKSKLESNISLTQRVLNTP